MPTPEELQRQMREKRLLELFEKMVKELEGIQKEIKQVSHDIRAATQKIR